MKNRITELFGIKYPIIAGGMVWCSGWRLASAVSNSGALGVIGAGSMHPETLKEHIQKCRKATQKPFGVNIPLLYPEMERVMDIVVEQRVPIVFTSAGDPTLWTKKLQQEGVIVAHVVSSSRFAIKCEQAGVDVVVAEGFEAGGHNGREETTTMVLIPQISAAISIPLIAAGGIATGEAMLAAIALGAEGVQLGTRFAITKESSASEEFKKLCTTLKEGDTMLALKKIVPTRLIKNEFYREIEQLESSGATKEEMATVLGRGRAKRGIFEGDLVNGELEIGQVSAMIDDIPSAEQVVREMVEGYDRSLKRVLNYYI